MSVDSVTFSTDVGGDGSTITDDESPTTGIRKGGHRTRFIPALTQMIAVANWMLGRAGADRLGWAYAQAFRLVSATRDSNGAITTASIVWPDGATGTFTTDTASTAFPGAIDAWHATYVLGMVSKTYTQPAVTRDANGAVTAQPAITVT